VPGGGREIRGPADLQSDGANFGPQTPGSLPRDSPDGQAPGIEVGRGRPATGFNDADGTGHIGCLVAPNPGQWDRSHGPQEMPRISVPFSQRDIQQTGLNRHSIVNAPWVLPALR